MAGQFSERARVKQRALNRHVRNPKEPTSRRPSVRTAFGSRKFYNVSLRE